MAKRRSRRSRRSSSRRSISPAWKKRHPKAKYACKVGGKLRGFKKKTAARKACGHTPRKVR